MSIPYHYSMYESSDLEMKVKEVKGVISVQDAELLFEYKVYDMYGNGISNLSKFAIQLDNIKRIQFKKGFLFTGGKLILVANQWAFFEPLPGSDQGKITLKIKRRDRNEAIRFSTRINLYMSQQRLDDMEDE
ncbi:hypothetical protein [Gracilimonas mengyeensis]|uniref:Uncharacterized protein n=1 Tax=Gracilimonas mengyeensis TaxID=1302730 RepID=A0A521F9X5_9BACT|nr:hypothetical protein [Gracilimonas mengyeensis]SMO92926.1 hypothetical protein SAMN06265219_11637 [Gracilimonas mengyeensis]